MGHRKIVDIFNSHNKIPFRDEYVNCNVYYKGWQLSI